MLKFFQLPLTLCKLGIQFILDILRLNRFAINTVHIDKTEFADGFRTCRNSKAGCSGKCRRPFLDLRFLNHTVPKFKLLERRTQLELETLNLVACLFLHRIGITEFHRP